MSSSPSVLVIDDSPTILKVVQLVLTKAGFRVETAADGEAGLQTARERRPDMILLDFVMPRMNGYQVCRTLAGEDALKAIPVVLMSAKGDQVGERFVKVMGIVDYITKPFSPEAITAVVQHTIGKFAGGAQVSASPLGRDALDVLPHDPELDAEGTPIPAPMPTLDSGAVRASAGPSPRAKTIEGDDDAGDTATALEEPPALEGDVRVVPIAEVLQLLQAQQQSGVLTLTRGHAKVDVFFRQGKVDLASAHGVAEEFLLGRFIVDNQLMTKTDFDAFLRSRAPGSKLLGTQLVKLGYISELELKQAISRQTCELVYEILRWNLGRFSFRATRDLPPVAVDASLGLDVEGILMEGFRRVDEWHLIEREVDDFDLVFLRNEDAVAQMGRGRLTREELTVLELVNGKHTIKEIIRQSKLGSFEVSKMLYRLLSIKLIRKRVMPVAV